MWIVGLTLGKNLWKIQCIYTFLLLSLACRNWSTASERFWTCHFWTHLQRLWRNVLRIWNHTKLNARRLRTSRSTNFDSVREPEPLAEAWQLLPALPRPSFIGSGSRVLHFGGMAVTKDWCEFTKASLRLRPGQAQGLHQWSVSVGCSTAKTRQRSGFVEKHLEGLAVGSFGFWIEPNSWNKDCFDQTPLTNDLASMIVFLWKGTSINSSSFTKNLSQLNRNSSWFLLLLSFLFPSNFIPPSSAASAAASAGTSAAASAGTSATSPLHC